MKQNLNFISKKDILELLIVQIGEFVKNINEKRKETHY